MNEHTNREDEIRILKERISRLTAAQDAPPNPVEPETATPRHEEPSSEQQIQESRAPDSWSSAGEPEMTVATSSIGLRGRVLQSPAARSIALFAFVGLGFGVTTLAYLGTTGMFDEGDIGGVFAGALVLMASLVSVAIAATFLAVLCGAYIGATHDGTGSAPLTAALATAGGHVLLVATFGIVLLIGFAVLITDFGATEPDAAFDEPAAEPEEGSHGWDMLLDLALPVIGSGSSGALAAWFYSWRPEQPALTRGPEAV